ncbi:MAG: gamma-glutamylcyclotransferase [Burkholderiaceae bacterium]|nr:gamma-glutamylcyclotransferase [Burkholderiales bacterium]TAL65040.1 MAG: gamma-glutamylcyclotransferase [Burkholderiaceae bacterium]TBR72889.1 MAG: gamma-glutamylcyclotransferase [Burkholderiaceae bacterium]
MAGPLIPVRDPAPMLAQALAAWGGRSDLWIFGYASLIWRPDFDFAEQRIARVQGWHRALKMWSRINRGTPECPGLVFALLSGGSCQGMAFRVRRQEAADVLATLWLREMVTGVYDPRWLHCRTPQGPIRALAFTLSRRSPSFTGELTPAQYRDIFGRSHGRYGSTQDYARQTLHSLRAQGIHDRTLARLLALAGEPDAPPPAR